MPFFLIALFTALLISSVSAFFNIAGMIAIFPGAVVAATIMGISLELGKLVSATFTYRYWNKSKILTRIFVGAVLILSLISSIDIFGYLSQAHMKGAQGLNTGADQIAFLQKSIETEEGVVRGETRGLENMDKVVSNFLTDTSKANRAEQVRNNQRAERQRATNKITQTNKNILSLQHQKDSVSKIQRVLEVNTGPLKYLASIFGISNMDKVVSWFIAVLVAVFDPLAILLLISANVHLKEIQTKKPSEVSQATSKIDNPLDEEEIQQKISELPNETFGPDIEITTPISPEPPSGSPITEPAHVFPEPDDFGFIKTKKELDHTKEEKWI